jgi:hypothetical protein
MKGSATTVFPGNNSAEGFYSYYRSGITAMEWIYILKGGPGTGKSTFMRHLAASFRDRGFDVELWQCSSDDDSLDGLLIPALKTAIIDGTAPHTMDPVYPGVREVILNFGDYWQNGTLLKDGDSIIALIDRIKETFDRAYGYLREAGSYDDQLLKLRETQKNAKNTTEINEIVKKIFGGETPVVRHLFAIAVTPSGIRNLTFDICHDMKKRYFLRGKRGLGQQSYLRTIIAAGEKYDTSMDIYHGHIHPEEIAMVVFSDLNTVVAAAEVIPAEEIKEGDHIINFAGEKTSEEEQRLEDRRDDVIKKGIAEIDKAHRLHDDLELFYSGAMDFESISRLEKSIFQKILKNGSKE